MQLFTKDVKEFLRRSRFIKSNTTLPILSYVKYENETLTKSNQSSYCIYKVQCDAEDALLIDERTLSDFSGMCSSDQFELERKDNVFVLRSGKLEMKYPVGDPALFPIAPKTDDTGDKIKLATDVLESIKIAASYTQSGMLETSLFYVHVKNGHEVFASNHPTVYYKEFPQYDLPQLMLSRDCCAAITAFSELEYYTAGKYDFFEIDGTVMGFIKTEAKPMAYEAVVGKFISGSGFTIAKASIENFCELAIPRSTSSTPVCNISDIGSELLFQLDDKTGSGAKNEYSFSKEINSVPSYDFNCVNLLAALKPLPYTELHITPFEKYGYILSSETDPTYKGVITSYVKE